MPTIPVGTATEILAFEKAVSAVLEFARRDGHTAVIIAADHSTGGLSIGNPDVGDLPLERFAGAMRRPKATPTKAAAVILDDPAAGPRQGPPDRRRAARDRRLEAGRDPRARRPRCGRRTSRSWSRFLARALSRRAGLGWVFTGHGGEDVALYGFHPRGRRLGGVVQNTDIALYIQDCLGLDLKGQTAERFVRADEAFEPPARSSRWIPRIRRIRSWSRRRRGEPSACRPTRASPSWTAVRSSWAAS